MIFPPHFFLHFLQCNIVLYLQASVFFQVLVEKKVWIRFPCVFVGGDYNVFASLGKYVNHFPGKYLGKPDYRILILCIPSLHSENTYPSPPQYYYQFCSEVVHRHLCILLLLPSELFLYNVFNACLPYGFTMKISLRGNSKLVVMHKVKLK